MLAPEPKHQYTGSAKQYDLLFHYAASVSHKKAKVAHISASLQHYSASLSNDKHRNLCLYQHLRRLAPQQHLLYAALTMRGQHDQISILKIGKANDCFGRQAVDFVCKLDVGPMLIDLPPLPPERTRSPARTRPEDCKNALSRLPLAPTSRRLPIPEREQAEQQDGDERVDEDHEEIVVGVVGVIDHIKEMAVGRAEHKEGPAEPGR